VRERVDGEQNGTTLSRHAQAHPHTNLLVRTAIPKIVRPVVVRLCLILAVKRLLLPVKQLRQEIDHGVVVGRERSGG
jgi:hypothetical protein